MKHPLPYTAGLVTLFFVAQILGLLIIGQYTTITEQGPSYGALPYGLERPDATPVEALIMIGVAVLVGTGLLLLIIKFKKLNLWKFWYFLSVFITLSVALAAFIPALGACIASFIGAAWKILQPNLIVHNLTELFIYGGLAAIFVPILNTAVALILLLGISAYDMFAVWKSKHMVSLATFQTESKLFAGFSVPYKGAKLGSGKVSAKAHRGPGMAILGGGDIGFPLLFAGTLLPEFGILKVSLVAVTATIALAALFAYSRRGRFYPAMPFITVGCLAGYGILLLM